MNKKTNPKADFLLEEDKGVSKARSPLAKLFRMVLYDMRVTPRDWRDMLNAYVKDPRNMVPNTGSDTNSVRGNLNKELKKPKMTFRSFVKGLRFLRPKSAKLELHISWFNGNTTIHEVSILDNRAQLAELAPMEANLEVLRGPTIRQVPMAQAVDMEELIQRVRQERLEAERTAQGESSSSPDAE